MCIAQLMIVPRTFSYDEDDAPDLLDFSKEATPILEANKNTEDQGHEFEPTFSSERWV